MADSELKIMDNSIQYIHQRVKVTNKKIESFVCKMSIPKINLMYEEKKCVNYKLKAYLKMN